MSEQKRTKNTKANHGTASSGAKKKKFNPVATFFKIVVSMVLVFCVAAGGAAFAYYKITGGAPGGNQSEPDNKTTLVDAIMKKDIKLNVAIFGVDGDGTRTDVIFVVHFDSGKKQTSLVSIPRDTRVTIAPTVRERLNQEGRYYTSPTKINSVHSYSGKEMGCENAVLQLEDLLGIQIDHYVKVDLVAFRKIVDAIGGVEVDVPRDMNYEDPYQDLYIHLKEGKQLLDGDKAEQLVRFRKYANGDVDRIQVQQLFLKEFAKKVLSTDTIKKNISDYISTVYNDVVTDINLVDALKYVNYIKFVDVNGITMDTIPGVGTTIGGASYYVYDVDGTQELVDKVFYGIGVETEEEVGSKGLNIEVANGGTVQGLAGKVGNMLQEKGYTVTSVSTYTGDKTDYTRIIVKEKGVGDDLKQYFDEARIVVDTSLLSPETDIKIIIGDKQQGI
jgi:LCP family protein required for cell wall assembly